MNAGDDRVASKISIPFVPLFGQLHQADEMPLNRRTVVQPSPQCRPKCQAADGKSRRRLGSKHLSVRKHHRRQALLRRRGREEAGDEMLTYPMAVTTATTSLAERTGLRLECQHPGHDSATLRVVRTLAEVQQLMRPPDHGYDRADPRSVSNKIILHIIDQAADQSLLILSRLSQYPAGQHTLASCGRRKVKRQPLEPLTGRRWRGQRITTRERHAASQGDTAGPGSSPPG